MVFYFSGTGNSQYVAKQIAQLLGDELVSINQYLKSGEKKYITHSARWCLWRPPMHEDCQRWWRRGFGRPNLKAAGMPIFF